MVASTEPYRDIRDQRDQGPGSGSGLESSSDPDPPSQSGVTAVDKGHEARGYTKPGVTSRNPINVGL